MANINDFKAQTCRWWRKTNQFKVTMPFPGYSQVGGEIEELAFLCKTTSVTGNDNSVILMFLSEVDKLRLRR